MKLSGYGLVWWEGFLLITDSISLLVISLFRFSISFWFNLGRLYVSRNSLILGCPIRWHIIFQSIVIILCISVVSAVISPLSFLILFIWALFFSWWAWQKICWFCLSLKDQLLVLLIYKRFWFFSLFTYFHSDFYYFLPSINFVLVLLFLALLV